MRSKYYERSHVVSVDFVKQTEISYIRPTLRLVVGGGFEPPKASPTDLQSVPFDHSGTPPEYFIYGARDRSWTRDILITSEALYQLSYSGGTFFYLSLIKLFLLLIFLFFIKSDIWRLYIKIVEYKE